MTLGTLPDALITRCAWCGRYGVGGQWLPKEDVAAFLRDDGSTVTHGSAQTVWRICGSANCPLRLTVFFEPRRAFSSARAARLERKGQGATSPNCGSAEGLSLLGKS